MLNRRCAIRRSIALERDGVARQPCSRFTDQMAAFTDGSTVIGSLSWDHDGCAELPVLRGWR